MRFTLALSTLAAVLFSTSCGVSTNYVKGAAPTAPYEVAVVKDFTYTGSESGKSKVSLTKEFTTVLQEEVQNTQKFSKVATGKYSGRAVRIEGDVTLLEEGNSALRIGVGFGTGKSHFFCKARIVDNSSGKLLGTFEVERSSRNGVIGIADNFLLVRRYAASDIAAKAAEFAAKP